MTHSNRASTKLLLLHVVACGFLLYLTSCGGKTSSTPPPIILTVSLANPVVTVPANGTPVYVPITIMAPTETATFAILGLPSGISNSYKESESNPSGLLTLVASSTTVLGRYMPTITVGSTGQTASVTFTLLVQPASK